MGDERRLPVITSVLRELGLSVAAVILALAMGALLIRAAGYSIADAYYNLYSGAFGSVYSIADTLVNSIPLLFTGLAIAFGFKAGLFNIGAEGQMYVGALATAVVAVSVPPAWGYLGILVALAAGALTGAAWGFFPGYLRARTGAHEVITTIMLNYIATLLTTYLVKHYFKAPGPVDQTPLVPPALRLPELIATTRLTWAIFLALALVATVHWLLTRTVLGYEISAVGMNPSAAAYAGVPVRQRMSLAMAISGAVAGLAGSTLVLGVLHRFITNFSPGYGFTGIAVAVLARNHPWGVVPAALLFGALQAGGLSMQLFARIPSDLMTVIQGLVILFVSAPALIQLLGGGLFGRSLRHRGRPRGIAAAASPPSSTLPEVPEPLPTDPASPAATGKPTRTHLAKARDEA